VTVQPGMVSGTPSTSMTQGGMTQVSYSQPAGRRVAVGKVQGVTLLLAQFKCGELRFGGGIESVGFSVIVNGAPSIDPACRSGGP
jgi:hypothetical protein